MMLVLDLHQDGAHGAVMQPALVFVENDGGNHHAQQQRADDGSQRACGAAVQLLDLQAEDPVTNAVTQQGNEHNLLNGENGKDGSR